MKSKKAMEIETFEERYRGNYLNKFFIKLNYFNLI